jgi:hypothetical protein
MILSDRSPPNPSPFSYCEAMAESNILTSSGKDVTAGEKEHGTKTLAEVELASSGTSADNASQTGTTSLVPLRMKLLSILLVTAVGFGSHWSSGVTGAMKSTLKKVSHLSMLVMAESF